jgi:hypothetical protein
VLTIKYKGIENPSCTEKEFKAIVKRNEMFENERKNRKKKNKTRVGTLLSKIKNLTLKNKKNVVYVSK